MSRFNTIDDVWEFLNTIPKFQNAGAIASNFNLDNIRSFCECLGNPQSRFPSIHVAGTNGKGTTCYLLEQIYTQADYKTGMFTSPHLLRYNERVRVNQEEISDQAILEFFQTAEKLFEEIPLSYFEISTALAFWYFAEQNVEIAIIETGLGGRLDSTNIINPRISVITSIGLDHQDILGDSIEEIAREKAGIIKKGRPVVAGNLQESALNEIKKKAQIEESELYFARDLKPEWNSGKVSLNNGAVTLNTSFIEKVNLWNVAMVWKVAELLQQNFPVSDTSLKESIESFQGAPGRFEKLNPHYDWYFSGSHNPEALESSLEALQEISPKENWVLIFSAMKDKWNSGSAALFKGFKETWFVEQEGERAKKFDEINKELQAKKLDENNAEIILKEMKTELVIFMGSFYFYPIAKRWTTDVS